MKNTSLALALSVLLVVVIGAGVFADEPAPPTPGAPPGAEVKMPVMPAPCIVPTTRILHPRMVDMLSARLNLGEDQKTKISDLLSSADEALTPQIEAQQQAARDFAVAFGKVDTSQADLIAAAEKAMKAETSIVTERIKTLYALRALLTAEQNKTLSDLLEQYTSPWRAQGTQSRTAPPRALPPPSDEGGEDRR